MLTFELFRYNTDREIASGDEKSLNILKMIIENQAIDITLKLQNLSSCVHEIEELVHTLRIKIISVIDDIDDGYYKAECDFENIRWKIIPPTITKVICDGERSGIVRLLGFFSDNETRGNVFLDEDIVITSNVLTWSKDRIDINFENWETRVYDMKAFLARDKHKIRVEVKGILSNTICITSNFFTGLCARDHRFY
jgi:hypothetical protein